MSSTNHSLLERASQDKKNEEYLLNSKYAIVSSCSTIQNEIISLDSKIKKLIGNKVECKNQRCFTKLEMASKNYLLFSQLKRLVLIPENINNLTNRIVEIIFKAFILPEEYSAIQKIFNQIIDEFSLAEIFRKYQDYKFFKIFFHDLDEQKHSTIEIAKIVLLRHDPSSFYSLPFCMKFGISNETLPQKEIEKKSINEFFSSWQKYISDEDFLDSLNRIDSDQNIENQINDIVKIVYEKIHNMFPYPVISIPFYKEIEPYYSPFKDFIQELFKRIIITYVQKSKSPIKETFSFYNKYIGLMAYLKMDILPPEGFNKNEQFYKIFIDQLTEKIKGVDEEFLQDVNKNYREWHMIIEKIPLEIRRFPSNNSSILKFINDPVFKRDTNLRSISIFYSTDTKSLMVVLAVSIFLIYELHVFEEDECSSLCPVSFTLLNYAANNISSNIFRDCINRSQNYNLDLDQIIYFTIQEFKESRLNFMNYMGNYIKIKKFNTFPSYLKLSSFEKMIIKNLGYLIATHKKNQCLVNPNIDYDMFFMSLQNVAFTLLPKEHFKNLFDPDDFIIRESFPTFNISQCHKINIPKN